jgi:hypothetical protein
MSRRRLPTGCRLCRRRLRPHERPEGICDRCLRANQTAPGALSVSRVSNDDAADEEAVEEATTAKVETAQTRRTADVYREDELSEKGC